MAKQPTPLPRSGEMVVLAETEGKAGTLAEVAVLRALRHFGAPHIVVGPGDGVSKALARHPAAVVIGSPGVLASTPSKERERLVSWVWNGGRLVNLDGAHPLGGIFKVQGQAEVSQCITPEGEHYCLETREPGEAVTLSEPLIIPKVGAAGFTTLLESEQGYPLLVAGKLGEGRVVQWLLPLPVWTFAHLGHCCGLDDLFWRSLVWAAHKPLAWLAMPPFATVRIDDASGSGSAFHAGPHGAAHRFRYVEALNCAGWKANVGLFIRDIPAKDHAALRLAVRGGGAEFSAHAFTEINDHPDHLIYMTHDGREYDWPELERNFAEVDAAFARFGVPLAPVLNCHYYEMGERALLPLRERGCRYLMTEIRAGVTYSDERARDWFPEPYGHFGYILGPLVDHPEFFNCLSQYNGPGGRNAGAADALHRFTTFAEEAAQNDPEGAGRKAAAMVRRGLDNLFFGVIMTHEQRIASLTGEEWERLLQATEKGLAGYERIPVRYSEVCRYALRRYRSRLEAVTVHEQALECRFAALERANLLLSVFAEADGQIARRLVPVRVGEPGPVRVDLPEHGI